MSYLEFTIGACGFALGAAVMTVWFSLSEKPEKVQANGIPMDRERILPPPPPVRVPEIHKLEMADGSVWYEARIGIMRRERGIGPLMLFMPLTDDQGNSRFKTLAEAQAVAEAYHKRKLSETVIKDTVV